MCVCVCVCLCVCVCVCVCVFLCVWQLQVVMIDTVILAEGSSLALAHEKVSSLPLPPFLFPSQGLSLVTRSQHGSGTLGLVTRSRHGAFLALRDT